MNSYYAVPMTSDEIYHHGIIGQKWGVRRFQNSDGSYTAAGKARYGIDSNGKMSKEGKTQEKIDRKYNRIVSKSAKAYSEAKRKANEGNDFGFTAADSYVRGKRKEAKANKYAKEHELKTKDFSSFGEMSKASKAAANNFVERTRDEKAKLFATDVAITIGTNLALRMTGVPLAVLYSHSSADYKYKTVDDKLARELKKKNG